MITEGGWILHVVFRYKLFQILIIIHCRYATKKTWLIKYETFTFQGANDGCNTEYVTMTQLQHTQEEEDALCLCHKEFCSSRVYSGVTTMAIITKSAETYLCFNSLIMSVIFYTAQCYLLKVLVS